LKIHIYIFRVALQIPPARRPSDRQCLALALDINMCQAHDLIK
jgi:hypothetical protein